MEQTIQAFSAKQPQQQKTQAPSSTTGKTGEFAKTLKEQLETSTPSESTAPATQEETETETDMTEEKPVTTQEQSLLAAMAMLQQYAQPTTSVSQEDLAALLGQPTTQEGTSQKGNTAAQVQTEDLQAVPQPLQQEMPQNGILATESKGTNQGEFLQAMVAQQQVETTPKTEVKPQTSTEQPVTSDQTISSEIPQPAVVTTEQPQQPTGDHAPVQQEGTLLAETKQTQPTTPTEAKTQQTTLAADTNSTIPTTLKVVAEEKLETTRPEMLPELPKEKEISQGNTTSLKEETTVEEKPKEKPLTTKEEYSTDYMRSMQDKLNSVLQTAPQTQETATVAMTPKEMAQVREADVPAQILQTLPPMTKDGIQEFEIQLEPEFLGKMTIKMALENQKLTLEFMAHTQKGEAAIRQGLVQLEQTLRSQDVQVDRITVTYDAFNNLNSSQNGQSGFQFQGRQQEQQTHRNHSGVRGGTTAADSSAEVSAAEAIQQKIAQMSLLNYRI